ncbi:unnamed protein product, partial [Parascedosporium putredinis]
DKEKSDL